MDFLYILLGLVWGFITYKISDFYAINLEQNWKSGQLKIHRMLKKIWNSQHYPNKRIVMYMLLSSTITTGFYYLVTFNNWPAALIILPLMLILLSIIDLRSKLLPNQFTYPLILLGIIFNMYYGFVPIESSLFAAGLGFGVPFTLNYLWVKLRKSTGMGMGDAKLYAAIGAWLGFKYLIAIFVAASFINVLVIICILIMGKLSLSSKIAYGPIITASTLLCLSLI